jgi:hypothetical protein
MVFYLRDLQTLANFAPLNANPIHYIIKKKPEQEKCLQTQLTTNAK